MNTHSSSCIKNNILLVSFDEVCQQAVNNVITLENHNDNECWLGIALIALTTTTDIDALITALKPIQNRFLSSRTRFLLGVYVDASLWPNIQQRVAFLQQLTDVADSVVLIPCLAGDKPAQALARFPQWISDLLHNEGMINLDMADIEIRLRSGLAFFGYAQKRDDTINEAINLIRQQWHDGYLPPAFVQNMMACIDGNENIGLEEYVEVGELLSQSRHPFVPTNDTVYVIGLTVNNDLLDQHFNIGVLFFGLEFI